MRITILALSLLAVTAGTAAAQTPIERITALIESEPSGVYVFDQVGSDGELKQIDFAINNEVCLSEMPALSVTYIAFSGVEVTYYDCGLDTDVEYYTQNGQLYSDPVESNIDNLYRSTLQVVNSYFGILERYN